MQRFGVNNGVVNDTKPPTVGQVDVKTRPMGHDLHALDHAYRFG